MCFTARTLPMAEASRRRKAPPRIEVDPVSWGPCDVQVALRLPSIAAAEDLWKSDVSFPGVVDHALGMIAIPEAVGAWARERVAALVKARAAAYTGPRKPKTEKEDAQGKGNERDQAVGDAGERAARAAQLLRGNR